MKKILDIYSFKGNRSEHGKVGVIVTDLLIDDQIDNSDIIYLSPRKVSEHFFRIFKGYGLSVNVYNDLIKNNVNKILIVTDDDKYYLSSIEEWKKSPVWMNETLDGQMDSQYILREPEMVLLKGGNENMVNISDFTKPTNMFLKAEEVEKNPTASFVITNEPVLVDTEFEGKKAQKVRVEGEFNKEPRQFDLSKTNARTIEKTLGSDTAKWVGHQLILGIYQTMTSKGKLTPAILIKEAK